MATHSTTLDYCLDLTFLLLTLTCTYMYTVEPLNKGHVGTRNFVLYREVSFIRRLKCNGIIRIWGEQICPL